MRRGFAILAIAAIIFSGIYIVSTNNLKNGGTITSDNIKIKEISLTSNQMIDIYLIACAVHMNFESGVVLPDKEKHRIYSNAQEYFGEYKDHVFLQNFEKYIYGEDVNGDAIGVLMAYSRDSKLEKLRDVDEKYRIGIFQEQRGIDEFINGLRGFYKDTKAEEFFSSNNGLQFDMDKYIADNYGDSKFSSLIDEMEDYLKKSQDGEADMVDYEMMLSLYRPGMASFYSYDKEESRVISSFQSPNDFTRNPYKFSMNSMVENAIHEYIHSYINGDVEKMVAHIKDEGNNIKQKVVNNGMYSGMPINRQVDEYLVRAIQTRLYAKVFGEEYAREAISDKEIKYGGFERLDEIIDMFKEYENSLKKSEDIYDYMPMIIKKLITE